MPTTRESGVTPAWGTIAIFDDDYASLTFSYPYHALAAAIEEKLKQILVANTFFGASNYYTYLAHRMLGESVRCCAMTQPWGPGAPDDPRRPEFSTQPIPMIGGASPEPQLVSIGDIVVTQSRVITPNGTRPIGEVQWTFADMSRSTQAIPVWAIVVACVGFFFVCVLSLLLLLVKEWRTEGWVQITVQGPGFAHTTSLPVSSPQQVADYAARVNYARSVSASAGA